MGIPGFGRTKIQFNTFTFEKSAEEARRFSKCENIYHKGQDLAWDGKEILQMLLKEHGGIHLSESKKRALEQIFLGTMWGEFAAWRISLEIADGVEPMEAKMAATSQAFDEARHFYTMHDYLEAMGEVPDHRRIHRAVRALLDLPLDVKSLPLKLLGMQIFIEPMALTLFQFIRESRPEPVIAELMKYYERDEARHVGLGMQYFPVLAGRMNPLEVARMIFFQFELIALGTYELKVLEPHFEELDLDPYRIMFNAWSKQNIVLEDTVRALGLDPSRVSASLGSVTSAMRAYLFSPDGERRSTRAQLRDAWRALRSDTRREVYFDRNAISAHDQHEILTERGLVGAGEGDSGIWER